MNDKREIWIKRIQDYKSSGLTAAKWCKKNGLTVHALRYRIHKFNKEKKQEESNQTQWASVLPTKSEITLDDSRSLKVTIGHSTIEVPKGFDPTTFESVVRILKEQC